MDKTWRRPVEDLADRTEAIARGEDLPAAKLVAGSRNSANRPCPNGGGNGHRHRTRMRALHDAGDRVNLGDWRQIGSDTRKEAVAPEWPDCRRATSITANRA